MNCYANKSCNGMHSCKWSGLPDNSVGMDETMKQKRESAAMNHPNKLGAGA